MQTKRARAQQRVAGRASRVACSALAQTQNYVLQFRMAKRVYTRRDAEQQNERRPLTTAATCHTKPRAAVAAVVVVVVACICVVLRT